MTGRHKARHGPEWHGDGVRFRLWAPSAQSVDLLLDDHQPQSMKSRGDGWYELDIKAKTGDLYRFKIDGRVDIPDPASRAQPEGPNGPSQLVRPDEFAPSTWRTKPWEEVVIYELHVGTFSKAGTYRGVEEKLDHLVRTGFTAIELMPLASFEGERGWGYDGVLPFAPHAAYGSPDELHQFIDQAHGHGLMVFLDVVYNHYGPAGNYLHEYAKPFFTDAFKTPWGSAINMADRNVRDFYIENALYWLGDFRFDGLRFDAVHAIEDASPKHILMELAETIRKSFPDVHLILENEKNQSQFLEVTRNGPRYYTAQWNDDIHHCYHVLLTGEKDSYYEDFKDTPLAQIGRCLTEGFAYQDDPSPHRNGETRGEKSAHLPPLPFVAFLQNHDQIGNRAKGDRLTKLTDKEHLILAISMLLLSPQPPMMFMGEEWGTTTPFLYFCDFDGTLGEAIREGRRNEFKKFPAFSDPAVRASIPDPNDPKTFENSKLNWSELTDNHYLSQLDLTRHLLELRTSHVVPLLKTKWIRNTFDIRHNKGLHVRWVFEAYTLEMLANFSGDTIPNLTANGQHVWGASGPNLPPWKSNWYVSKTHG